MNIRQASEAYLISTGLHEVSHLRSVKINYALVTVFVERWRQETHSFHLSVDEATIMLKDIVVLLRLRIDGRLITSPPTPDWRVICEGLLGDTPITIT